MRSRMAKQVQELQLRWSQESFWQEGQARGAVRVCKVMGLDQAGACEYLWALLPELPREDAERLIRYYWRDDIDSTAATERIDDKIKHRITMAIYRTQYNGACCEQLEESYLNGAVYALARRSIAAARSWTRIICSGQRTVWSFRWRI